MRSGALLRGLAVARDLLPLALDLLRAVEVRDRLRAAAEPEERLADVVVRVRLVELTAALERGERLLRDRERFLVPAVVEELRRLVGERDAVAALLLRWRLLLLRRRLLRLRRHRDALRRPRRGRDEGPHHRLPLRLLRLRL